MRRFTRFTTPATLSARLALALAACAGSANAQFAPSNPPPTFFVNPTSTMGTVTGNTLVLTPLPNGFTVAGQVTITIPPGPVSGNLVSWSVIRRIDPAFSGSGLMTNTVLTGFSAPPPGTFGAASGTVSSSWRFFAGSGFVGGSLSSIPMTLVNGIDSPPWTGLTANSGGSGFTWTAGFFPGAVMQQDFTLNANYTSGPGGTWVVDVPVTSVTFVPPACPSDFNGDGVVNTADLTVVLGNFGHTVTPGTNGDLNNDGVVNTLDLTIILGAFGTSCP